MMLKASRKANKKKKKRSSKQTNIDDRTTTPLSYSRALEVGSDPLLYIYAISHNPAFNSAELS